MRPVEQCDWDTW